MPTMNVSTEPTTEETAAMTAAPIASLTPAPRLEDRGGAPVGRRGAGARWRRKDRLGVCRALGLVRLCRRRPSSGRQRRARDPRAGLQASPCSGEIRRLRPGSSPLAFRRFGGLPAFPNAPPLRCSGPVTPRAVPLLGHVPNYQRSCTELSAHLRHIVARGTAHGGRHAWFSSLPHEGLRRCAPSERAVALATACRS
jgi:hypothetical protein